MDIPSYDREFSLVTNNLPFPNQDNTLRNRWEHWRHPNWFNNRRGYQRIPEEAETSFNNSTPEEQVPIEPFDEIIDIPEGVSETTGLLSGATAAGATFGGATSAVGTIGTAATGILAGTAIGIGGKALYDRISEKGAVLPNSEFIGPGNPIHIGAAKNPSEQAAKEHDVNYTNLINYAKQHEISQKDFTERVHQFDQAAIDLFEKDWQETGNWHAFAGKYGLKLKQAVEKALGETIYPRNPGKLYTNILMHIYKVPLCCRECLDHWDRRLINVQIGTI